MPTITALPTQIVRALQAGEPDSHGQSPERAISNGAGTPCRHCLKDTPEGQEMLILAHRPFPAPQPYAETGPIFLCASPCARHEGTAMPEVLTASPDYLLKGYSSDHRIVYGTGMVTAADAILQRADTLFQDPKVAYVHIRSARNNCYLARLDRP